MYKFIRAILFCLPAETAHHLTAGMMRVAYAIPPVRWIFRACYRVKHTSLERDFCGLHFANPVGLAAGFDKNARLFKAFSMLGFSFIEIGTVTPLPQPGNPKPRLFRIVGDEAIINRMGFNNDGLEAVVKRLKRSHRGLIIGGNIGKNTQTANEDAAADYMACCEALYPYVDYLTVNVSCPNIAGLSALQNPATLRGILQKLLNFRSVQEIRKPILLKISPDLSIIYLDQVLDMVAELGIDGIVAFNTTTTRTGLSLDKAAIDSIGKGGLSGRPLKWKTLETINYVRQRSKGKLPIIGVGGITTPDDAVSLLNAGATLVQLYTGLIYEGPGLVKRILRKLKVEN